MQRDSLRSLAAFSMFSHDPRTHNAARLYDPRTGLFGPTGYNQVPAWLEPLDGRVGPAGKHTYIEHAERDVIYTAARLGWRTEGCELHSVWAACPECARAIIASGITEVHTAAATYSATPERWKLKVRKGLAMLEEASVEVVFYRSLGVSILFNGEELEL